MIRPKKNCKSCFQEHQMPIKRNHSCLTLYQLIQMHGSRTNHCEVTLAPASAVSHALGACSDASEAGGEEDETGVGGTEETGRSAA